MRRSQNQWRLLYTAAATLALLPGPVRAQTQSVRADVEQMARDGWSVLSAPARGTTADWQSAALAAGGFALLVPLDEPIDRWLRDHDGSALHGVLGVFGESSPLNMLGRTPQFLLPLSGALYGAGRVTNSRALQDAGLGCATTNLATTMSRMLISVVVGRLRPEENGGAFVFKPLGGVKDWSLRSFPGGHAANAIGCTAFFSHRFELGVAEPLLYAVATAVSLARIQDGAHWTSDTFVGMAYGYAVGKGVAARYAARDRQQHTEQSMQPRVYLGWKLTF